MLQQYAGQPVFPASRHTTSDALAPKLCCAAGGELEQINCCLVTRPFRQQSDIWVRTRSGQRAERCNQTQSDGLSLLPGQDRGDVLLCERAEAGHHAESNSRTKADVPSINIAESCSITGSD
jgi:hypothetical protein